MQQFYCPITPSTASQSCNCTQRWHGSSRVVAPDCARFVRSAGSRFGTALRCAEQRLCPDHFAKGLLSFLFMCLPDDCFAGWPAQDSSGCHSCVYLVYCPILFRQESSKCNYITIFAYVFTLDSALHEYESICSIFLPHPYFPDSVKGCERNGNVSCHSGDFTAAVEPRFKYENKKSFTRRTKDLRIVARNGSMQTPILHGAGMDLEPHLHILQLHLAKVWKHMATGCKVQPQRNVANFKHQGASADQLNRCSSGTFTAPGRLPSFFF